MRRREVLVAAAATMLVAAWVVAQLLSIAVQPGLRVRTERTERLGTETARGPGLVFVPRANRVILTPAGGTAQATWAMRPYEFLHDLGAAHGCGFEVYVIGRLGRTSSRTEAEVLLNGTLLRRIGSSPHVMDPVRAAFGTAPIASLAMTPLFQPAAIRLPVGSAAVCRAPAWNVTLRVKHALWQIDRVGITVRYTPVPPSGAARAWWIALALLEAIVLAAALFTVCALVCRRFGPFAVVCCVFVTLVSTLTHDQWDFPVWPRFVDLSAFGHGNPAGMWLGTPLWPLLVALFVPLAAAGSAFGSLGSQEATTVWLKLALAILFCATAYALATSATRTKERIVFFCALLAPFGLYELAAGYREIVAGALMLLGLHLAQRNRFLLSVVVLAAAGSVSEALLPLLLLPGAMLLIRPERARARDVLAAGTVTLVGLLCVALQWAILIPHAAASAAVTQRVESYRYGGGSWLSALDTFGLVPTWVPGHGFALFFGVFGMLAVVPVVVGLRAIVSTTLPIEERRLRVLGCMTSLLAAFLLAYRGVDPSTWYAPFLAFAYTAWRRDEASTFPLLLWLAGAATYYAICGIGDFVDWWFLAPQDAGLLGILGTPVAIGVGATVALIACAYVAGWTGRWKVLTGAGTPLALVVFALCGLAGSNRTLLPDICLLGVFTVASLLWMYEMRPELPEGGATRTYVVLALLLGLLAATVRAQNAGATLVLVAGLFLAPELAIGDLVLVVTGTALLLVQGGNGAASSIGYDGLLFAVAVLAARTTWRLRRSFT